MAWIAWIAVTKYLTRQAAYAIMHTHIETDEAEVKVSYAPYRESGIAESRVEMQDIIMGR